MPARSDSIESFLATAGWPHARRAPLAGDASFRRYERIFSGGRQAVLMDAPPDKEDVHPFMRACGQLLGHGLSAPRILASDITRGLLLLEDLGDDLYTHVLRKNPSEEEVLYLAAADVLVDLYHQSAQTDYSAFAPYDDRELLRECGLLAEWFLPAVMGPERAADPAREYTALWQQLLAKRPLLRPVLVVRDYHADNLVWLPDRKGAKRVGLLDFQDAVTGSPAYDVVSYLEDARRDVKAATVKRVLDYYLGATGMPAADFMTDYALLGAQRNCKIAGIFVRLAARDGKHQYLSYLPRVWRHLERDLKHPSLKPLKDWMDRVVRTEWRGAISIGKPGAKAAG